MSMYESEELEVAESEFLEFIQDHKVPSWPEDAEVEEDQGDGTRIARDSEKVIRGISSS